MFDTLKTSIARVRALVSGLDREHLSERDAAALVELFAELERLGAAGRSLAAKRVANSNLWQRQGYRSAADWLAAKIGTDTGCAVAALKTVGDLEDMPALREAFTSGVLSEAQAQHVANAARVDPLAESALVEAARCKPLKALKEDCQRIRDAAVVDDVAAYKRVHAARYFRTWREDDSVRVDGRFTIDDGAILINALRVRQEQIFKTARAEGRRESPGAYAADALIALARGAASSSADAGPAKPIATEVAVVIDYETYVTAKKRADTRCEISGVGPIPADAARSMAGDSFLKAVVMKGEDIHSVVHFGRTIPARIRSGLDVRDPSCRVPGCAETQHLEIDHWRIEYADGGPTTMDNLVRVCRFHHRQKTLDGYRLTGGPGNWRWHPPHELDRDPHPPPDG